ncbi:hypothetical protein T4C_12026 [Trichinella pseudospiralis]|uniref:Uncharacterized protein n=1 Tax=Trichinella pseudospiralis TaxID=6337 RepID=A0A0V1JTE3_TRIPS|nr:hypothetical protein T4C_12026 [Trichinella pseudospiralis]
MVFGLLLITLSRLKADMIYCELCMVIHLFFWMILNRWWTHPCELVACLVNVYFVVWVVVMCCLMILSVLSAVEKRS